MNRPVYICVSQYSDELQAGAMLVAADESYTYLGGGALELPPILSALGSLHQEIIYCLEFPGGGEPDEWIRRSLAYLRDL